MSTSQRLLAVGVNRRNLELLADLLAKGDYATRTAVGLDQFDSALRSGERFDVAIVDVAGFTRDVWSRCDQLNKRGTPIIVICPAPSPAMQSEAIAHGAQAVLVKPVRGKELLQLVQRMLGAGDEPDCSPRGPS